MRKHKFILYSILLGYICSLLILGCQSSGKPSSQSVQNAVGQPAAVQPASPVASAPEKVPVQVAQTQEVGGGSPQQPQANEAVDPAEARLREQERRWQLEKEANQVLAQNYIKSARNYAQQGKYAEAYHFVIEALKLTPEDAEALRLKQEYGKQLGYRDEKVAERIDEAENLVKVKVEQARVEIQNRYEEGKRLYHKGEYKKAIRYFEGAKELIRWLPYHAVDLKGQIKQIDWYIEKCRQLHVQKEAELKRKQAELARQQAEREEQERLLTQKHRIRLLFRRANLSFEREHYDLTEQLCNEILRLEPQNEQAMRLKEIAVQARHSKFSDDYQKNYLEQWKRVMEQTDRATLPNVDVVVFPSFEEWKRISARGEKGQIKKEKEMTPTERAIRTKLQTEHVTLDFSEAPLTQVIDFLRTTSGINMIIDPQVFTEIPDEESLNVNLKVENLKLENVLNLILSLQGLDYRIDGEVLIISTKKKINPKPVLQLYNIRDLTSRLQDFAGLDISLENASSGSEESGGLRIEEEQEEAGVLSEEELTNLIKDNIGKDTWEGGDATIEIRNGTLIVRQTPQIQKQVASLLKDLRRATGLLVNIETRFIRVSDTFLEEVGVDWRGVGTYIDANGADASERGADPLGIEDTALPVGGTYKPLDDLLFGQDAPAGTGNAAGITYNKPDDMDVRSRIENMFDQALGGTHQIDSSGGLNYQFAFLDDVELQAILNAVRKSERANLISAPRLTAFNTQRANVSILRQIAYVRDFDVEVAQNSQIADPIVGTAQGGVVLDVRPIISANRKWITLELRPAAADVQLNPDDSWVTPLSARVTVTIERPRISLTKVQTTVTIPDGGTLLIGGQSFMEERDQTSTIPFLGDIPLLSFGASRKGKFKMRDVLLILVTAKIVSMEEHEPREGLHR